jgi:hypothetical protein
MGERQNTIVCVFDPKSPRISAYQIHEWIHEQLKLREQDIQMIQVDGPRRCVYIKFCDYERMQAVIRELPGQMEYRHDNGELSLVQIEIAGIGVRRIRVAGLPPEISDSTLRDFMSTYSDVKTITQELWSRAYRYPVSNGIRIVEIGLEAHIPSQMMVVGYRLLISYEGQPLTCYKYN